ncbi:inositol monophosphatase family protein [Inquilinus limosus]|uniref:inositol monophosphatase family protein n=1 Tax=Inquilinus limosus TaxID=171674 RepID=UPI0009DE6DAA|nr:inositol monophosphatase family protein [Inquilinus limosus]
MAGRSPLITVMIRAAQKAGRGLVRDFGEVENLQVSRKGPADFVSAADLKAEETLRDELTRARPRFGWIMEEGGVIEGEDKDRRWVVDPLDGTTNFLHGIPHFAISIALEQDGVPVAGVIFNPVTDELYWAEKGAGAFLNDRRLRVSSRKNLADSLIGTGMPFMGRGDSLAYQRELQMIMPHVAGIRRMGAASLDLAYVAAGRFDGFWETGLNPWDIAAGIVLVQEAGGFVTDVDGKSPALNADTAVAGNVLIHKTLAMAITKARAPRAPKTAAAS